MVNEILAGKTVICENKEVFSCLNVACPPASNLRELGKFEKWCEFYGLKAVLSRINYLKNGKTGEEKALGLMRQYKLNQELWESDKAILFNSENMKRSRFKVIAPFERTVTSKTHVTEISGTKLKQQHKIEGDENLTSYEIFAKKCSRKFRQRYLFNTQKSSLLFRIGCKICGLMCGYNTKHSKRFCTEMTAKDHFSGFDFHIINHSEISPITPKSSL